jgi:hypothetical protein
LRHTPVAHGWETEQVAQVDVSTTLSYLHVQLSAGE